MSIEFQKSLNGLGLSFANLVDSIALYVKGKDKTIPTVKILDKKLYTLSM